MKISSFSAWPVACPLTRPYTIAFHTFDSVQMMVVRLSDDEGRVGVGTATPVEEITGESFAACRDALSYDRLAWLLGRDVRRLPALCRQLRERLPHNPAARAAVDIALHDLWAQALGVPLVEALGRAHHSLPTSVTIGIKPADEALAEADEYLGRGFRILKVKAGQSLDEDLERLARLRDHVGREIVIRVDPNQGYTSEEVLRFVERTAKLEIEFLEQPMLAGDLEGLCALPDAVRRRIAADESLLDESDGLRLLSPTPACGIWNIKLMKCGGVFPAGRIAALAELGGIELMWGCMDESIASITAALSVALASPATRYLDLDGSFDLAGDVVEGGFILENGCLRAPDSPGLGVRLLE
ncbi:dipeptide epimerase [bacterium]|nr:dipeptide epimerase [bacterium]